MQKNYAEFIYNILQNEINRGQTFHLEVQDWYADV